MVRDQETRKKFEEIQGEPGYSAGDVMRALYGLGISNCDSTTIRKYAIRNSLAMSLSEMGIETQKGIPQHLIPESRLRNLIKGMNYSVPFEALEQEIKKSG